MDRIHCYYQHSFDLGNRLTENEKIDIQHDPNKGKDDESWEELITNKGVTELCKILQTKRNALGLVRKLLNIRMNKYSNLDQRSQKHIIINIHDEWSSRYHYGYLFHYGKQNAFCDFSNIKNKILRRNIIKVLPKYSHLKDEVTEKRSGFTVLLMEQFNKELNKAELHQNTHYCKSNFVPAFKVQHVLSLMMYCNYHSLQYQLSKTYRENKGKDHSEFYFWGKYLKEAVQLFGTKICNGNIKKLYHGIGEQLSVNVFMDQMKGLNIGCPLSTTSCFSVAVNFTNNNGLVLQFCDGSSFSWSSYGSRYRHESPTYFSASWLSDFPNEHEYLFVQTSVLTGNLMIDNIINVNSGMEYKLIIHALYSRHKDDHPNPSHVGIPTNKYRYHNDVSTASIVKKIMNKIWLCDLRSSEFDFIKDAYTIELVEMYLRHESGFMGTRLNRIKDYYRKDCWIKENVCSKWSLGTIYHCVRLITLFVCYIGFVACLWFARED
eukprot:378127_1